MHNEELTDEELTNEFGYSAPLAKELLKKPAAPENPTPNNPPWNSLIAFGFWILSVLAIGIFPALLVVPYFLMNRHNSPESLQTDSTAILLNLLGIIPAHLFTLGIAWFIATRNGKFSLNETLGLRAGGFRWWYYPLLLIVFFAVAGVVSYFIPEGDNALLQMLRSSRAAVYMVAIMATFTAPIVEEVVYRGILYSAFQRTLSVPWAVVAVTMLFAGVHFIQYWGSPGTILLICVMSLLLTLIRVKTDNLLPCIVMHTIFNGIQSAALILEPYLPKSDLQIEQKAAFLIRFLS